jgi:hypothetical protein
MWVWLTLTYIGMSYPTVGNYLMSEHHKNKFAYAQNAASAKIVVAGDSNVWFGVKTAMMEEQLKKPCVNMGYSADFGIKYSTHIIKQVAFPGDTIILSFTYDLYDRDSNVISPLLLNYIFNFDYDYYNDLSYANKIYYTFSFGQNFANITSPAELIVMLSGRMMNRKASTRYINDVFRLDANNKNGDQTKNVLQNNEILFDLSKIVKNKMSFNENVQKDIAAFDNWCKNNNVRLFITFPSSYDRWFYGNDISQLAEQITYFCQANDIELLGQYTDFIYGFSDMYDGVNHLNNMGMEKRTWKNKSSLLVE